MTTEPSTGPAHEDLALAREFARRFLGRVGRQPFRISLFGSRARGDADAESDLDLFVALESDDPYGRVKDIALDIARDLTLEHGVLVSAFVADRRFLERHQGFSFIDTVEAEASACERTGDREPPAPRGAQPPGRAEPTCATTATMTSQSRVPTMRSSML